MKHIITSLLLLCAFYGNSQLLYLEEDDFEVKYYPKRIEEVNRLIAGDSTEISYYYHRANMKYKLKEYQKCIDDYRLILQKFGEKQEAFANMGMSYCFLNDSARSISNMKKAVSMNLSYARNHLNLGFIYLYFNQYAAAIPSLEQAVALDKTYAKAFYYLGYAYLMTGNFEKARTNLSKSISLAEYNPEGFYNLGVLSYKQGHYSEAAEHLSKALEYRPSLSSRKELFLMRGESYKQIGEAEKAKRDFETAGKLPVTN